MTVDLAKLTHELRRDAAGIWRLPSSSGAKPSFPVDGHRSCLAIEDDSFWFAHRNACITAALERHGVIGPLVDIGGGNGIVSLALERSGIETVVVEPGEEGARNARQRGLAHVVCAMLEELELAPGSFGAAGMFDVLEHVEGAAAMLREVHRILRPGGTLCVTVPAFAWLWSNEDEHAGHHRRYTLRTLRAALEDAGFEVRYDTYLFAVLTAPVFVMRSLPYRLSRGARERTAQRAAEQHVTSRRVRRVIDALLAPELARVCDGRTIPCGTTCLAIAVRA